MKTKAFFNKILWTCVALLLSLFCVFQSAHIKIANAEETTVAYTDVMTDLQKDENFNPDDYPVKANDYSLQVIQIAESVNNELFVYVYQPSNDTKDLVATNLSMYNGYSENGKDFSPLLYDLTLLSTNGVFDKYVVNDYLVSTNAERWYNIVSLYRLPVEGIDTNIAGGTTDKISISVGQQWRFYYYNDILTVERGTFNTLKIDIVTADNIIYNNGFTAGNLVGLYNRGSSHFVCFNVEDYIIEHIYDADVTYLSRPVSIYSGIGVPDDKYGEYERHTVTLYDNDTASFEGTGWFSKTYKWNRISRSEDFVSNLESQDVDFDSSAKSTILSSQWTFAFCETERRLTSVNGWTISSYTEVSEVSILRLHFIDFRGNYYNLGVVANAVTEDDTPAGTADPVKDALEDFWKDLTSLFSEMWGWLLGILLLGGLVIVLLNFAPWIFALVGKGFLVAFKWIGKGLLWILKLVWRIICLPFKLIGKLFKRK